jgi:Tfp pilus assembly protein PilF
MEYFERALKLAPQDAESSYQFGVLLDRNGRTARGREYLERAIALRANYPDPLYALAKIEFRDGDPKSAALLLERAVKCAPDTDFIHLLLARVYQATGQQEKAKTEFAEVRRIQSARLDKTVAQFQGEEPALPLEPSPTLGQK